MTTATLKRHAALVDRMATTLNVDLEEATLRGALPPETLVDAVLRCTGCANPDACDHWLEDHQGTVEHSPPSYCRNTELLKSLAP